MSETFHIFIGYDEVEPVAWHALAESILGQASMPVAIHPVKLSMLPEMVRPRDPRQSNEFSYSRFLVPHLQDSGWALFLDADMLVRCDIADLWRLRDDTKAVQVVKHDYVPKLRTKYLGNIQYRYPRKNWSSVMLFNCEHQATKALTPSLVNVATGAYLHRFDWIDDGDIGELSTEWNHLVGEYDYNPEARIVHWTNFGPWLDGHEDEDYADEWRDWMNVTTFAVQEPTT